VLFHQYCRHDATKKIPLRSVLLASTFRCAIPFLDLFLQIGYGLTSPSFLIRARP